MCSCNCARGAYFHDRCREDIPGSVLCAPFLLPNLTSVTHRRRRAGEHRVGCLGESDCTARPLLRLRMFRVTSEARLATAIGGDAKGPEPELTHGLL
jgi:hypothetical protein